MPAAPACALLKNPQGQYLTSGVEEAYAYDGMGRRTAETRDPEGLNLTTAFTYDSEGRLTRTTRPDGKHSDSTYDYAGNRLTFADEKERMTEYFYDNESRLIRVEASAQAPVEYVYDDAGNMLYIEVNDDEYRRTDYAYDKLNRRTSETFPEGYNNQRNVRYYGYDATHNVSTYRDGRDVLTVFGRDGAGRVISKTYEVPENRPEIREVPDVLYSYDANGNLTGISNSDGAASWSYDSLDRLETEQVGNGPQITYVYDPRGVILSETVTRQSKLSADHEYDAVGRRIKTTQDGQETEFVWDNAMRRTKVTLPSGEYTEYAYDNVDRQEDIYYRKADDTLFEHYAYFYDDVGNPTAIETMNGDYAYGYDTAYRLTSESRTDFKPYSISHVYDLVGNRTQRTTNGVVRTFTYNKADQITGWSESSTDKTAEYVYDSDGNTVQKLVYEDNDLIDQWDYEFDSVGRMNTGTQSEGGTQSIANVYAGDQWYRVSETINSTTRKYGWRRDELFAEFNSSGELTAGYLNSGVDQPLFKTRFEDDGETVTARDFYHQDANLRVHHVTDADGDVSEKYVYTGYGERKILDSSDNDLSASAIGNRIGFQGREHEDLQGPGQAHGLTFHRNRFYDPDTGRWERRDPIGYFSADISTVKYKAFHDVFPTLSQAIHEYHHNPIDKMNAFYLYGFESNNPIINIDKSGLISISEFKWALRNLDCSFKALQIRDRVQHKMEDRYGLEKDGTALNAIKHCVWMAMTASLECCGPEAAKELGDTHERTPNNPKNDKKMDLHNNGAGLRCRGLTTNWNQAFACCEAMLRHGSLKWHKAIKQSDFDQIKPRFETLFRGPNAGGPSSPVADPPPPHG
jgi:YD repeat-containing protein